MVGGWDEMQPQQFERLAGRRCFECEPIGQDVGVEGECAWPIRSQCPLAQHWADEQQPSA